MYIYTYICTSKYTDTHITHTHTLHHTRTRTHISHTHTLPHTHMRTHAQKHGRYLPNEGSDSRAAQ